MTIEEGVLYLKSKARYADLCEETIRDVYERCVAGTDGEKAARKVAAKRLHRIWANYLGEPDYSRAAEELAEAFDSNDDTEIRMVCRRIMGTHASARERLELLDGGYYENIWKITSRPRILVDLAAALHPLSFLWMKLDRNARYHT